MPKTHALWLRGDMRAVSDGTGNSLFKANRATFDSSFESFHIVAPFVDRLCPASASTLRTPWFQPISVLAHANAPGLVVPVMKRAGHFRHIRMQKEFVTLLDDLLALSVPVLLYN